MKNFLTAMLGALVALCIFSFCAFLLFIGLLGAIISLGAKKAEPEGKFEKGSYLVFDLSENIVDAPPVFDLGDLRSDRPDTLQLRTVVRLLHHAASDERIAGILLKGGFTPGGVGSGYGALKELRDALAQFRRSGKPVKAFLEEATTRDYYVASVADEIALDPYGMIFMPGLATEPMFFAGAFEKYGVGVQVTRVGSTSPSSSPSPARK